MVAVPLGGEDPRVGGRRSPPRLPGDSPDLGLGRHQAREPGEGGAGGLEERG